MSLFCPTLTGGVKGLSRSYCSYFEQISEGDYIENFSFFHARKKKILSARP
jgi:hypothetical protein